MANLSGALDSHPSHHQTSTTHPRRQSYLLSVQPVDYSLTSGTDIPAPLDSPPPSPRPDLRKQKSRPRLSRPPTSGGGPLSSHPTNEDTAIPGARPPTPDAEEHNLPKTSVDTNGISRFRADSFNSPTSPTAPTMDHAPGQQRGPVRRLFSLTSLRQSFSSSRASLSQRPETSHSTYQAPNQYSYRAESPAMSTTNSSMAPPTISRFSAEPQRPTTALRKKRSSSWFNSVKRKSQFFGMNEDGTLDVLEENGPEHKRFKEYQKPTLPEIGSLSGGSLDGGSLGWDEQLFKSS